MGRTMTTGSAAKKKPQKQASTRTSADAQVLLRGQRRDRRLSRNRGQIADAAVRLFERQGYSATTIEEIAAAADFSTSTFFRMFADKEEVLFYDFPERLDELRAIFAQPHGNAWQAIRRAFIDFAQRWDAEADDLGCRRARLFHAEPSLRARYLARNAEWEETIQQILIAEFGDNAQGRLSASVVAGAAVAAFRAAWRAQLASRQPPPLVTCVREAFDQLEHIGPFFRAAAAKPPATKAASKTTAKRAAR